MSYSLAKTGELSPVITVTEQPVRARIRARSARCDSTPPVVGGNAQWISPIRIGSEKRLIVSSLR